MNAAALARQLGGDGTPNADGWYRCLCPAHADSSPSLSLKDGRRGRIILHCFAGCTVPAVAEKLRAVAAGGDVPPAPAPCEPADPLAWARHILRATVPAADTVVETYWQFRGLALPLPKTVRFHSRLLHKPSGRRFPAMVAMVTNPAEELLGVHRTWLAADGRGKAGVAPDKMSLGPVGGGAVHLGEGGSVLLLAEGVETAASASMLLGVPVAWAALSTSGMKSVIVPSTHTEVVIAADHDANGAGLDAAETLRRRLLIEHHKVRILQPKEPGTDFNDVLLSRGGIAA